MHRRFVSSLRESFPLKKLIVVRRSFHPEVTTDEKVTRTSNFDLSKPMVGRTNGDLKRQISEETFLIDFLLKQNISAEQMALSLLAPDMPADSELLKVAIIGSPNAGKSTFVNRLMSWRVRRVFSSRFFNVNCFLFYEDIVSIEACSYDSSSNYGSANRCE